MWMLLQASIKAMPACRNSMLQAHSLWQPCSFHGPMHDLAPEHFRGSAQVANAVVAAYDSGELQRVLGEAEGFKGWVKALGKAQKRKGKRLFMPLRLALTGSTHVRLLLARVLHRPAQALWRTGIACMHPSCTAAWLPLH